MFVRGDLEAAGRLLENPDFVRFLDLVGELRDLSEAGFVENTAASFEEYVKWQAQAWAFGEVLRLPGLMLDSGGDQTDE